MDRKLKQLRELYGSKMLEGGSSHAWYVLEYNVDEESLVAQKRQGVHPHNTEVVYRDKIVFKVPSVASEPEEKTLSRLRNLDPFSKQQALSKAANRARRKEHGQVDSWVEANIDIGPNRIEVDGETVVFPPAKTRKVSAQQAKKAISGGGKLVDLTKVEEMNASGMGKEATLWLDSMVGAGAANEAVFSGGPAGAQPAMGSVTAMRGGKMGHGKVTEPLSVELIYNMAMDKGIPKPAYMKAYKAMNGNLKQLKQWVDVYMEGADISDTAEQEPYECDNCGYPIPWSKADAEADRSEYGVRWLKDCPNCGATNVVGMSG